MRRFANRATLALLSLFAAASLGRWTNVMAEDAGSGRVDYQALYAQESFSQFMLTYAGPYSDGGLVEILAADLNSVQSQASVDMKFRRILATGAALVGTDQALDRYKARHVLEILEKSPYLTYAEPDLITKLATEVTPATVPNDTYLDRQWYLYPVQPTTDDRLGVDAGINVFSGWDSAIGTSTTIALIDSGYTWHTDFGAARRFGPNQFVLRVEGHAYYPAGYDFVSDVPITPGGPSFDKNDPALQGPGNALGRDSWAEDPGSYTTEAPITASSWHGTHVMGLAVAIYNNAYGIAGVAPGAKIIPVRASGYGGYGYVSDAVDAIVWASGGNNVPGYPGPHADVINMSFASNTACLAGSQYQNAINTAYSNGSVLVAAAGNGNVDVQNISPASCNHVIAVGATSKSGKRSIFPAFASNWGAKVDVAAPGGGFVTINELGQVDKPIYSTMNGGATTQGAWTFGYKDGTSMAAPQVAALAALILSKNSALNPDQVEALIKTKAHVWGVGGLPTPDRALGTGLIDVAATLAAVP